MADVVFSTLFLRRCGLFHTVLRSTLPGGDVRWRGRVVGMAGPGGCGARWAPALSVMGSTALEVP